MSGFYLEKNAARLTPPMVMFFAPFVLPPSLIPIISIFVVLVLVHNKTLPDSARLFLVFVQFFRAICGKGIIETLLFVFCCIYEHRILSSLSRLELCRR
jgi:hypothetical protein